jgi:hypothetical protein
MGEAPAGEPMWRPSRLTGLTGLTCAADATDKNKQTIFHLRTA